MKATNNLVLFEGGFNVKNFKEAQNEKDAFAFVSICQNYKNKNEEELQNWQTFTVYGKKAEKLNELQKGAIRVEARLTSYKNEDGHYVEQKVIDSFDILNK